MSPRASLTERSPTSGDDARVSLDDWWAAGRAADGATERERADSSDGGWSGAWVSAVSSLVPPQLPDTSESHQPADGATKPGDEAERRGDAPCVVK